MFRSKHVAMRYLATGLDVGLVWFYFFGSFIALVGCTSFIINTKIILLFPKAFRSRDKRFENWNLLSLAIADLGMCCCTFPQVLYAAINGGWNMGIAACTFDAMAGGVFAGAQIWSLTATAVERYKVIRKTWSNTPSTKSLIARLVTVWGIPIAMALMPLFGLGRYMPDGIFINCTFNYIERDLNNVVYVLLLLFMYVIAPVVIIFCCYIGIVRVNRRSASDFKRIAGSENLSMRMRRREANLIKTIVIIIICFLASWSPYTIIAIASLLGYEVSSAIATSAVCFAKASTVFNAGLYTALHPNYKRLVWKKSTLSGQDSKPSRSCNSDKESLKKLQTIKEQPQVMNLLD